MNWLWWLLAGILIGWLLSTLIEWLWFRSKRMEARDDRVAELEKALHTPVAPVAPGAASGAVMAGSDTTPGVAVPQADTPDVQLSAPSLDTDVDMPDVSVPAVAMPAAEIPDIEIPDVEIPDVEMPDMGEVSAEIEAALPDVEMPDVEMPDVEMPDVGEVSAEIEAALPDVEMPDVEMPDVDLPDGDDASAGVAAAVMGVGTAVSAGVMGEDEDETEEADAGADVSAAADISPAAAAMLANTNYPDDLTNIKGIGRVYETRLYEAGIFTWDQVANSSVQELEELTQAIDAANAVEWPAQAQTLAEANNRVGARYAGPVPDKFSKIKGLGETAEQRLYWAGIFTYAQLAATSPEDLAAIMPTSRGDFADWVVQAAALA